MRSLTHKSARVLHWNSVYRKDYPQAFACITLSAITSVSIIVLGMKALF